MTLRLLLSGFSLYILAGCATTNPVPNPVPNPDPNLGASPSIIIDIKTAPIAAPIPDTPADTPSNTASDQIAKPVLPEPVPDPTPKPVKLPSYDSGFKDLKFWQNTDPRPALSAFQKTCQIWRKQEGERWQENERWLDANHHAFGQIKDWQAVCSFALEIKSQNQSQSRSAAVHFFQSNFEPVNLYSTPQTGLLTGYYAPEINVRLKADTVFNAPLLALPATPKTQNLPRKNLGANSSKVLAYGRPIDVFFLQVQGSGRIMFKDGTSYIAAYAGHNSHKYKSIGRVLIQRGELDKNSVSKQAIEKWMDKAGPIAAQELMNENPRYIYFKTQYVDDNSQPKGAVGVALTPLGSLAIDPRHLPYGALVWLETKLPVRGGDFKGQATGLLVIAQDTGSAIKGKSRGDLYFGMGDAAGAKAGVMKHKAVWTVLLPVPLAIKAQALGFAVADIS